MCTPKESKLFINTINDISTREMPHFTRFTLDFDETDFSDEFPVKDRYVSRKRHHASKRDKGKHYNKKSNHTLRDWRLYESGFNFNKGKSHNQDSLEYFTGLDMKSYNNTDDFINGNDIVKDDNENKENIMSLFDEVKYDFWDTCTVMEILRANAIYVSCEMANKIAKELLEKAAEETRKKKRKTQIDNEREICGYDVVYVDTYYDKILISHCDTKIEAKDIKANLEGNKYDYKIIPCLSYTKEQLKEIKELGFRPIPGCYKPNECV